MKRTVSILAMVLVFALCLLPATALAEKATVTVNGTASVSVKPDYACVSLGAQAQAATVMEAQSQANAQIKAVREALRKADVPDECISIGQLNVYAQYDYDSTIPTITGYTASHQLTVRLNDIETAGSIIDAALAAGANQMDGLTFCVNDDSAAYDEALKAAIADAQRKAGVACTAAGLSLGSLTSLAEQSSYSYTGMQESAMAADDSTNAPTELAGGMVTVESSVSMTYEMN